MPRTRAFKSGNSQAVRIPAELAYTDTDIDLEISRVGDVITIFPEFFHGPFDFGVIRRGREKGLVEIRIPDLRDFTSVRHRSVDDRRCAEAFLD